MGAEESLDSLVLMGDSRVGLIVWVAIRHCSGPATCSHSGVSAWHGQTVNNKQQAPHTVLVRPEHISSPDDHTWLGLRPSDHMELRDGRLKWTLRT